jgi:hypothetical protein
MRFFRLRRKPESDEEEKELVLDADTEEEALAQDIIEAEEEAPQSAAEAATPTEEEAPAPAGDLLAQIGAEADAEIKAEIEAEKEAPGTEGGSPQGGDSLDPDLLDIFRSAKEEVQESTLASELEDIPAQDLLSDLVGVSHRLRAMPRSHAGPGQEQK